MSKSPRAVAQFLLCLLCLCAFAGCEADRYHVILLVDAKLYRPGMTWSQIREEGFANRSGTGMRAESVEGKSLPLFRFMHSSRGLMPLDESTLHFSTPLIVEKKNSKFILVLERAGAVTTRRSVDLSALVPTTDKEDPFYARISYYILPVVLP